MKNVTPHERQDTSLALGHRRGRVVDERVVLG